MDPGVDGLVALGVLAEPQRARIYAHLASAEQPRTRQEVCEALGIGRTLVGFHLDKLQRTGLVRTVRASVARSGRGRPPQRYTVSDRDLIATVPPRRYELLADVLVRAAAEQAPDEPLQAAALRVARKTGSELARAELDKAAEPCGVEALTQLLTRLGYQPRQDGKAVILTNCPFQRLRMRDTELVCSINAALGAGYLEGLGMSEGLTSRLRACPVNCCVVLERTA